MERCLSSKRLYEGRILNLRVDQVEVSRNGRRATREVVEHRSAVAVLARDGEGRFLLVRQFRYPLNAEIVEIPAGLMERGEEPLQSAQRELREETGYRASKWTPMPAIFSSPGFSDEKLFVFLAEELAWDPLRPDDDEDIALLRFDDEQARALLGSSDPQDAKTLMALAWYFARQVIFHET
ncbi:NUDIX hydrolase [Pyramidobacter sp. SM-530-WT-4B]|uniref:NUDIX hydrolase n=1 Tax=Pyramidobacter porci TaxID=2605789 RepID=A0A6L5YCJ7_9BACT|nr:NUDIX hydrolase [Pyramidobacter porci]MCI6261030.1 NUDIX hydrolase [Pyramidobacter sp.]MDY2649276.1 NUDIX hydrolase [Pyramidobacter porci]MST55277.1 NUDIX hydrolase [Pyramidobacter porci]